MKVSIGVLMLLGAALPGQEPEFDARVKAALDRGRPVLLKKLSRGTGGELALLCLAAVHDGVPRDNKVLVKAMKKLSRIKLSAHVRRGTPTDGRVGVRRSACPRAKRR